MISNIDFRAVSHDLLTANPTSKLYFLLDHSGLPGLHRELQANSAEWMSLFQCKNEKNMLAVAPILVLIGDEANIRLSRYLFDWIGKYGSYTSTILMLSSPLQIVPLTSRLSKRIEVKLSEGMEAMLRYFDPRTFEGLMKILSPEQLGAFLSPAEKWLYVDRAGKLKSMEAIFKKDDDFGASLVLTAEQEFDLIDASEPDQVLSSLLENAPELIERQLPAAAAYDFVKENVKSARDLGIESMRDLILYNMIALVKGKDFMKGDVWLGLMEARKSKSVEFFQLISFIEADEI